MTLRYKEDALEQIRDRQSPGEMRADRRTSILEAYRRTNDISLDEALLNALDLGIEHMAQRDRRRGVNKVAALGIMLAFLASGFGGYAFAKSKAPELLSKEWAKNIEMRLARAEDDIQENASHLDELEY